MLVPLSLPSISIFELQRHEMMSSTLRGRAFSSILQTLSSRFAFPKIRKVETRRSIEKL